MLRTRATALVAAGLKRGRQHPLPAVAIVTPCNRGGFALLRNVVEHHQLVRTASREGSGFAVPHSHWITVTVHLWFVDF